MSRRDAPLFFPGELRAFAAVLGFALLIFLIAALHHAKGFLMKRLITLTAVAAAALALSACATSQSQTDLLKQLDTNFAGCERHITFQAGVGVITPGASVSGSVDCKGTPSAPAATAPPA